MSLRMSLMRAIHRRKLDRIPNEEDRLRKYQSRNENTQAWYHAYRVVEDPVQVTLIGIELHPPTVHISSCISRA
jgi:hypothetical protein